MDYTAQITSSVACLHIILFLGADPKIIWNLLVKHKKETRIKELENKTLLFGYFSVGRLEWLKAIWNIKILQCRLWTIFKEINWQINK